MNSFGFPRAPPARFVTQSFFFAAAAVVGNPSKLPVPLRLYNCDTRAILPAVSSS